MAKKFHKNLINVVPTPHIRAKLGQIASRVLMPGDPKRAKWIADNYLTGAKLVSDVRGIFAYTGKYKNTNVTVMAHGMGIPSIYIYTYELFKFYNAKVIYRIGSCGATHKSGCDVGDVVLVNKAYADIPVSKWIKIKPVNHCFNPDASCNKNIRETAKALNIKYSEQPALCQTFFYSEAPAGAKLPCEILEMESWGLFLTAKMFNRKAACLLTVSDDVTDGVGMTWQERQTSFKTMVKLALEAIIKEKVVDYEAK